MKDKDSTEQGEAVQRDRWKERLFTLSSKMRKGTRAGTGVDPRIAERAQKVREKEERRAFKQAVWLLLVMAVMGGGIWLLHSPYLAVQKVVVGGEVASTASEQMAYGGVFKGAPMFSVDVELLREAVLSDPWVAKAEVEKEWPNTVRVNVEERYPVAWALTGQGWRALSSDGVALEIEPERVMPRITGLAGAVLELSHPSLGPALGFVEHLRPDLRLGAVIEVHGQQVTAEVAKRIVRLGRAADMEEKATVLGVLVDDYTDPGEIINLFSALRPAVYRVKFG